jgi:hypothetical protein
MTGEVGRLMGGFFTLLQGASASGGVGRGLAPARPPVPVVPPVPERPFDVGTPAAHSVRTPRGRGLGRRGTAPTSIGRGTGSRSPHPPPPPPAGRGKCATTPTSVGMGVGLKSPPPPPAHPDAKVDDDTESMSSAASTPV